MRTLVRGRAEDARWARPALIALLVCAGAAYLWDLSASGNANSFYAAAVQAGTKSWKAFFFGSLDPSNFITVDKPPASIWVMALSGRIFGFSSASMLIPQVLEGVGAVALLHAAVKRWFGAGAGLMAASTTPTRCWCVCWWPRPIAWFARWRAPRRAGFSPSGR
jgi:4-amino-4-deoxy-L-arabinose transferase-like glycosyltransferase